MTVSLYARPVACPIVVLCLLFMVGLSRIVHKISLTISNFDLEDMYDEDGIWSNRHFLLTEYWGFNGSKLIAFLSLLQPPPIIPTVGENILQQDGAVLEQPPTSQPLGPFAPLQGGILEEPTKSDESTPSPTGQDVLPKEGVLQQQPPPADRGAAAPQTAEPPTGEGTQSRIPTSPTGGCIPFIRTNCVPCDPGLPGASCIPESEWPPVSATDTGTAQAAEPSTSPSAPLVGEISPEAEQPSTTDEAIPPQVVEEEPLPSCPEDPVLDEETGLCVVEETEAAEEPPAEEEQRSEEESGSEDNSD